MHLLSGHKSVISQRHRAGQRGPRLETGLARIAIATTLGYLCLPGCLGLPVRAQHTEAALPTLDRVGDRLDSGANPRREPGPDANILQPGDEFELTVLGFPDLSGRQTILADGSIQLPLVGSVAVEGLTPNQVIEKLTVSLVPYVRRPQVGLALLSTRPAQIAVTGAVRRPGAHLLVPPEALDEDSETSGEEFQTLTHALISAGGVTPDADLRNIVIRRRLSPANSPTATDRSQQEIRVNLWSLIQDGDLSADVRIYNGDEVVVPTAQLASGDREKLLDSTLAPESISVQVAGGVRNPGQLQIAPSANVVTAVIAAGGFNEDARKEEIALFRVSPEGQLEQKVYAFGEASETLEDGDVVIVGTKKRRLRRALGIIGAILNPFDF